MRKAIIQQGRAADLTKTSDGYVASGESSFSRRAAHSDHVRLNSYEKKRAHVRQSRDNAANIRVQEIELERMQRATLVEHDQVRLAKLRKNIEIKSRFVARLKREKQELAEGIETIPGADEFEKWSNI